MEEPVNSRGKLDGQLPVAHFYLDNSGRTERNMPEALTHRRHH